MILIPWGAPFHMLHKLCLLHSKSCSYNYDEKHSGATQRMEDAKWELRKDGFAFNQARVRLGQGEQTFVKGIRLLEAWRHFQLGWASVDAKTNVKVGERYCVRLHEFCLCILSPLEIVYVNDSRKSSVGISHSRGVSTLETKSNMKGNFAFGSGTLEGHLLAGEEMFAIKWEEDNSVWYEILSFSKPAHVLSKVMYPYVQWRQKIFADHSTKAMLKGIDSSSM